MDWDSAFPAEADCEVEKSNPSPTDELAATWAASDDDEEADAARDALADSCWAALTVCAPDPPRPMLMWVEVDAAALAIVLAPDSDDPNVAPADVD